MQPPALQELALRARAVHLSQQRERLPVAAEQDVLSVVDDALAQLDSPRAAAQLRCSVEHGDRASRGCERDRGREPRPASTDDGDARFRHAASLDASTTTKSSRRARLSRAA
jgi:hypothetical protein